MVAAILAWVVAWAAISGAYWFAALMLIANAFGREGNEKHIAGAMTALALWAALSTLAWKRTGPRRTPGL